MDAGASYVVTQMFFDNPQVFLNFVWKNVREMGIRIFPIIPGASNPLPPFPRSSTCPGFFSWTLSGFDLLAALEKMQSNADVKEVGIGMAIQQSRELIGLWGGYPAASYTMSRGRCHL